jgi:hypothetical protein
MKPKGDRRGRVAAAALASQAAWRRQRGGRSSPASQPTASDFIGSTAKAIFSVRPHVEHSKVRSSKPGSPEEIRAKATLCLHTEHIGRSCGDLIRLAPAVDVPVYPSMAAAFTRDRNAGVPDELVRRAIRKCRPARPRPQPR